MTTDMPKRVRAAMASRWGTYVYACLPSGPSGSREIAAGGLGRPGRTPTAGQRYLSRQTSCMRPKL